MSMDQDIRINFLYTLKPDGKSAEEMVKDLAKIEAERQSAQQISLRADTVGADNRSALNKIIGALNMDTSSISDPNQKNKADTTKFISEQFDKLASTLTRGINMAFGVVDDIYKEIKKSSPLLQTVESLFNLAMQLFFMPLGNKLAEVLLPSVVNLVETAAKMWDELGNGGLGEIFSTAMQYIITALAGFFKDIGTQLKDQKGIVGSIGSIMLAIGNFIEGPGLRVIETLLKVVSFVMEHLRTLISVVIGFRAASLYMQAVTTQAIIASNRTVAGTTDPASSTAASASVWKALVSAAAFGGGGGVIGYEVLGIIGNADGGVVPHTPGGKLIMAGENEDELIIPKSKVGSMGSVTNNFYGYTSEDIREMIDRSISEKISVSYIKGGF